MKKTTTVCLKLQHLYLFCYMYVTLHDLLPSIFKFKQLALHDYNDRKLDLSMLRCQKDYGDVSANIYRIWYLTKVCRNLTANSQRSFGVYNCFGEVTASLRQKAAMFTKCLRITAHYLQMSMASNNVHRKLTIG